MRTAMLGLIMFTASVIAGQTGAWSLATPAAQWSARHAPTTAVFNGKLWIMGGYAGADRNDVWSSADGIAWVQETPAAPWPIRNNHATIVYDGKMWVMGGNSGVPINDVWYSTNGVNWTQATAAAPWTGRYGLGIAVFDNRLWVLGGWDGTRRNDVWSTTDGTNWVQSPTPPWSGRRWHTSLVFDNRMWVLGGSDAAGYVSDVWSTVDGTTWVQETAAAAWPARSRHTTAVFHNRMWIMGGVGNAPSPKNDVWSSADGANWVLETATAPWSPRYAHAGAVFNDLLWVIGGLDTTQRNDEWSYLDWVPQITSAPVTTAAVNSPYQYTITATGTPAPGFGATGLPPWLSLTGNVLSGVPGPGDMGLTGIITLSATNSAGTTTQNFVIDVGGEPPQFTSAPVTTAAVGMSYSYTVSAAGVPAPSFSAGTLPTWLSFNAALGQLTGVPTPGDIGLSAQIDITADNGWAPPAVQSFQVAVSGTPPQITSAPPTTATVGQLYSYTITGVGNPPPAFSVSGQPAWLTLTGDTLSGTPSSVHLGPTGVITITAANGWIPDATQAFQIIVEGVPPTFTSTPVLTATPRQGYSYFPAATGTPAPTISVNGALPSWLTYNAATGELHGIPAPSDGLNDFQVSFIAANGYAPDAVHDFTISVGPDPGIGTGNGGSGGGGCATTGNPAYPLALLVVALLLHGMMRTARRGRAASAT